ncbi:DNA glycosylase [Leifsonia xyli subsp. cynodontis DSM 46306]|uniref:Endonuclease/exonuclease/phosphatase domain-containing protein n=1 Tax=Leifsonia xyli subsp. cynodontis DSM 46306 TaxID=1389489 RepID=U3PAF7_LEIXC|nr:endonuclease/exonuclease/phosphatase family protein [Leifsonia xyli]AGW41802.1 DNA glycosylase [Leifsonia xyli subsp. cynodontis DSM 46306]
MDTSGVPPWAGFIARPEDRHLPTIVVAHLQRATFFDGADWRRDLQWAEEACSTASTIAVGDFNATVENLPRQRLNACADAATSVGADGAGTWPTLLPAFLGARIDHVFLGSGWDTKSFQVLTGDSASDHRPIFATIGEK